MGFSQECIGFNLRDVHDKFRKKKFTFFFQKPTFFSIKYKKSYVEKHDWTVWMKIMNPTIFNLHASLQAEAGPLVRTSQINLVHDSNDLNDRGL